MFQETKEGSPIAFTDDDLYYHEEDFDIGKTINVGGRDIVIVDCDAFTRNFYIEHHNRNMVRIGHLLDYLFQV